MKNKIAMVSLALVAFSTASIAHTQPASAAVNLGGVDLSKYCATTYPVYRPKAVLVGNNAYSWRCRIPLTTLAWPYWDFNIDMNAVCRAQRGNTAYAKTNNPNSPYSWQCYR